MQGLDGLELLQRAIQQLERPEVLLISGYGTVRTVVEAMKSGAYDFIAKPLRTEELMVKLKHAIERKRLRDQYRRIQDAFSEEETTPEKKIVAANGSMRELLRMIDVVKDVDSTVLVTGESGTGKEMVAQAIHYQGRRASGPFVPVNCSALPESLLESELFGHVKGSFTGASADRIGLFEAAGGGTVMLDEIGEMPLTTQAKLLRVLQESEIRRVGSSTYRKINARVIASTNKDLCLQVKHGLFREDLYYRLNVIPIHILPLRERKEDILPLAHHFLSCQNKNLKKNIEGFSIPVIERMLSYHWPGNVRELENLIERCAIFCNSGRVELNDFEACFAMGRETSHKDEERYGKLDSMHDVFEKEVILKTLMKNDWNRSKTARELCIAYNTLWRKMKKYELNRRT
jgi:DNA-binding NtrC family response regulator